ncbi:1-deoxy-D-xylulose 5-phosphate reductoisomerase [Sporotomaculum syntrophicum]|uniref:1-deoxy-D-xylulose 5-phosphate reductoisomerase n=1 Tax=Sporotomaculum syntrophicum TaxID=182264 RepID=A0A9D2WPI6_9FIRM|nr:1-deoxy-D-xylulose-5-phosphate reductoisomerase [Sporotomaculum syntrophicum]KAF1084561.1 1-deoxy-D-xylulose 5-phosphate reductoisomerase [Sporotomaculum syntrophicum]
MKQLAILGSTGSIGRQTLQVIDSTPNTIKPVALAAGNNKLLFLEQVKKYKPQLISMQHEEDARWLQQQLDGFHQKIDICYGSEGLLAVATFSDADTVLTAISGAVGLQPTVAAIKAGKTIALANKETLVAAGELIMLLAREYGVHIMPVDSEHSAIWQCLQGENSHDVARLILTASGGPFRSWSSEQMAAITPAMALNHPNWQMGAKITVDSATLMNKGLEVIEARWLFDISYDNINVVIHPQSIIHSMVEFNDGSVLAQMGVPDMRLPIQYALFYPQRLAGKAPRLQWPIGELTFAEPDYERFPSLNLAFQAGRVGKTMPAVLNAANEMAVHAFLAGRLEFKAIPKLVAKVMEEHSPVQYNSLEDIMEMDSWARHRVEEIIG